MEIGTKYFDQYWTYEIEIENLPNKVKEHNFLLLLESIVGNAKDDTVWQHLLHCLEPKTPPPVPGLREETPTTLRSSGVSHSSETHELLDRRMEVEVLNMEEWGDIEQFRLKLLPLPKHWQKLADLILDKGEVEGKPVFNKDSKHWFDWPSTNSEAQTQKFLKSIVEKVHDAAIELSDAAIKQYEVEHSKTRS